MSEITVTPQHIVSSTRPMHGISTALAEGGAQIGSHADAAAGCTSGGDTVAQVFADWSSALPQFAAAADRMILALTMSAAGYQGTDDAIAQDAS